jgi:hypothetical protein
MTCCKSLQHSFLLSYSNIILDPSQIQKYLNTSLTPHIPLIPPQNQSHLARYRGTTLPPQIYYPSKAICSSQWLRRIRDISSRILSSWQMPDHRCTSICKTLSNNVVLVIGSAQWKNDHLKLEVDINAEWTVDFAF